MTEGLSIQRLTCGYVGKPVLREVSFSLARGESVALLGPNGSGKSTLLKALTKTLPLTSGDVVIDGEPLAGLSFGDLAKCIGFVPQEETASFPFPVRDVIGLARISRSCGLRDGPDDRRIVEAAARAADCFELLDRVISELSGGERQRVLIARALAQEAQILLLDEPTSHLDVKHQSQIARLIRRLAGEGKGILTAIHDLNLASRIADRALLMRDGEIVMDAPVETVLASPQLDEVYESAFQRHRIDDQLYVVAVA